MEQVVANVSMTRFDENLFVVIHDGTKVLDRYRGDDSSVKGYLQRREYGHETPLLLQPLDFMPEGYYLTSNGLTYRMEADVLVLMPVQFFKTPIPQPDF